MAIKKLCNKNGCNELIVIGNKYCDKHRYQEQTDKRDRNRYYDEHVRSKEAAAFYHEK